MLGYPTIHAKDMERVHRVKGGPVLHFIAEVELVRLEATVSPTALTPS